MKPDTDILLNRLRESTRELHDRLESKTYGDKIMAGSLTAAEYRKLIDWQRRTHEVLEPQINGFRHGDYGYLPRFIAPASSPKTVDLPTALGTLYVLEGASLGGSVIYRKLQENQHLGSEAPFTFYRQQAESGLQQWRSLLQILKSVQLSEEEINRATNSARSAFSRFDSEWRESE